MQVRHALMEDIEEMVELGKRGHANSANAAYKFDEMRAKILGAQAICSKQMCAFVVIKDSKIVGLLLGQDQEYPYIKMRFASDLAVYSEAPGAGTLLIKRFTKWALDERRVDQLLLGVSFGGKSAKATDALYRRLGFTCDGGIYTKQREVAP